MASQHAASSTDRAVRLVDHGRTNSPPTLVGSRSISSSAFDGRRYWLDLDPCSSRMLAAMRIGELARRTDTTTKTIRYYEKIGLLPAPKRAPNDYREYSEESVERLLFVRDAQATGLTLSEIGSILDLRRDGQTTCQHVIGLLERHMAALDHHIETLRLTRKKLGDLTKQARQLDPADCVDLNRCQTIRPGYSADPNPAPGRPLSPARSGHHH